ncbi:hypothetical protein AB0E59_39100 [Lentzea sp. NPDC034063]|uniref:integrase n=1 Tax=unclassified Lentzea TaxID=2643253 RepID=UPI0033D4EC12
MDAAAYRQHVIARLNDYFRAEGILWTRRLWDVGSILALEELYEVGIWQPRKVIAPSAMDWHRRQLKRLVGPDHGMGDKNLRRELVALLESSQLADPSPGHRRLRQLIDHARVDYLDRWSAALQAGKECKPERLARTMASHLLDLGYTAEFLTSWIAGFSRSHATINDIIVAASDLARQPTREFTVLLALDTIPNRAVAEQTSGWLHRGAVVDWLKTHGHDSSGVRSGGGFEYKISARDSYAAAEKARQVYERLLARSQFIRKNRGGLTALPQLWVAGHSEPLALAGRARSADVLALVHMNHLYDANGQRSPIDDALELAAPINQSGAPGPAVAGAWAAVESLLAHPGDPSEEERSGKAIAADRLAKIIACSWPRAELTTLVYRHKATGPGDDLVRRATSCDTNRERAQVMLAEIEANKLGNLNFAGLTRYNDLAAAERVLECTNDPKRILNEISEAVTIALRRLYRARNMVLHGGSTSSVVLEAALRTAAPLVGAGLDRIAHHFFESSTNPLDLAARAELAIDLVGGDTTLSLVDLLERAGTR